MELCFEIELLSDYHIGSGYGRGEFIDSALFRDTDGVPAIRGSALAGLLRDGLRELLKHPKLRKYAACSDAKGDAQLPTDEAGRYCRNQPCAVCRLFGSPSQPKSWEISTARPAEAVSPRRDPLQGETPSAQVVHRASIDPRTRRAEAGKLFGSEEGAKAMKFFFTATCTEPRHAKRDAALLVAAVRMVRQLGRNRCRGLGECVLRLRNQCNEDASSQDALLDDFQKFWLEGKTESDSGAESSSPWQAAPTKAALPLRLGLLVRTDEPVLIAEGQQAGNQIRGLDYIPGTVLMGAFAARAARKWDLSDISSDLYRSFVAVFRRGRVRFPALYPAIDTKDGCVCPTIRAPADLLACQLFSAFDGQIDSSSVHPSVGPVAAMDTIPPACPDCRRSFEVPLESVPGYLPLDSVPGKNKRPPCHQVRMREEMHVRIDPATKTASHGNLFSYLAIDAGQYFSGEIEFADQQAQADFLQLVGLEEQAFPWDLTLRLGRAMRRGYGKVQLAVGKLEEPDISGRIAAPAASRVASLEQPIVLTFLTDTILTDPWGRYRHSVDAQWIRDDVLGGVWGDLELKNQFMSVRPVDGFFAHLGRPRQREIAIEAGSAVGFRLRNVDPLRGDAIRARLEQSEREGLGLRRGEGFGCIALNHPIYNPSRFRGLRLPIPEPLVLDTSSAGHLESCQRFIDEWSYRLDSILDPGSFRDKRWLALSHWLLAHTDDGLGPIREEFKQFQPDEASRKEACLGSPGRLFRFEPAVFRERNFFCKDAVAGMTCMLRALGELAELSRGESAAETESLGLRMLAERVAGLAKEVNREES